MDVDERVHFGDNNMHKEQCIGPVPGAFQCFSEAASINRSTTASRRWTRETCTMMAKCKLECVAPSCGQTVIVFAATPEIFVFLFFFLVLIQVF